LTYILKVSVRKNNL